MYGELEQQRIKKRIQNLVDLKLGLQIEFQGENKKKISETGVEETRQTTIGKNDGVIIYKGGRVRFCLGLEIPKLPSVFVRL